MGLDILIIADNYKQVRKLDYNGVQSLSRTFCNLMCRKDVINGEPELNQISRITGVDITPLYSMEKYWNDEMLDSELSWAVSNEEKQQIVKRAQTDNENLNNNIDTVLNTINELIEKLQGINNLPQLLNDNGWDTLESKHYFSDFTIDKGEGYIENNFGQDLRIFKRFLEYAKANGAIPFGLIMDD